MDVVLSLPPREHQVALALARGESYAEIAVSLSTSRETVKRQAKSVWRKLNDLLDGVGLVALGTETSRREVLREALAGRGEMSPQTVTAHSVDQALYQARRMCALGSVADAIATLHPFIYQSQLRLQQGDAGSAFLRRFYELLDLEAGLHLYVEPVDGITEMLNPILSRTRELADHLDDDGLRVRVLFRQLDGAHVSIRRDPRRAQSLVRLLVPSMGFLRSEEALSAAGISMLIAAELGDKGTHDKYLKYVQELLDRGPDGRVSALSLAVAAQRAARGMGRISRFSDSRFSEEAVVDVLGRGHALFRAAVELEDYGTLSSLKGTELRFPRSMLELSSWGLLDLGGRQREYVAEVAKLSRIIGDLRSPAEWVN